MYLPKNPCYARDAPEGTILFDMHRSFHLKVETSLIKYFVMLIIQM